MKVTTFIWRLIIVIATVFMPVIKMHAQQNDALVDVLVQKGVLSDRERQDILAKEQQDYSQTAASKISLSSSIKTIQFYGDNSVYLECDRAVYHGLNLPIQWCWHLADLCAKACADTKSQL